MALAYASEPVIVDLNDFIDQRFEEVNRNSTIAGEVQTFIDPSNFRGADLSNGTFFGLNTLKRTGNCYEATSENGLVFREVHLGLEFALVSFSRVTFEGQVSSALIVSHNNSIHYAFEHKPGTCYFKITNFEFDFLEWTAYAFPTPRRKTFTCLEEELNSKMMTWKEKFEKTYEEICNRERNATFLLPNSSPIVRLHSLLSQ